MKKMKNKGSATIIILVMFSIALIFAMATLHIVLNDNTKTVSVGDWNDTYYKLDAKAVESQFLIQEALSKAEQKTIQYMYNKEYLKSESTYLPTYAQAKVVDFYKISSPEKTKIDTIMNRIYLFYANAFLEDLINQVPELLILKTNEEALVFDITVKCIFKADDDFTLEFTQVVNPISYDFTLNGNGDITYTKTNGTRVTTTSYFTSQPLLEEQE